MTSEAQEREHSVLSPSSAHRWRNCAGSVNAERGLPDIVGREAAEGTLFHEHAELALRFGIAPKHFRTGLTNIIDGHSVAYDDDMIRYLTEGIEYITAMIDDEAICFVEEKVRIEKYTLEPGGKGTSDLSIIYPKRRKIVIFDWKYGYVPVSPVENDQECLYALGVWESFAGELFGWDAADIDVEFIIWQPRVPGGGGIWNTTMEWLLAEGERIQADARATYAEDAPRTPGIKQCAYCKAAGKCPALRKFNLEQWSIRFDEIDDGIEWGVELPDPGLDDWTPAQKAYVLLHRKMFDRWFERLHKDVMADLNAGRKIPHVKAVTGDAGHRFWDSSFEDSVKRILEKELGEKAYVKKMLTPAQAQTALGKRKYDLLLKKYAKQPAGKPILVPDTDPRPAIETYGDMFDRLHDETEIAA